MNSVRQSCRPKHQVLILKCYPRFQKGAQEVKPNSSELSYLLYYASTRRTKLQKVGAFLEKRAARDVWRGRLGNVQVTLQILTALIEKLPRDLPLYAHSVLTVIETVLRSNDISMVEATIPTFETFCSNQDVAVLAADQKYASQYQNIVRTYATFTSPTSYVPSRTPLNPPMALRWRDTGLKAIRSVVSSEAVGTDGGKQLGIVVPVILENIYAGGEDVLLTLKMKAQNPEKTERDQMRRRRTSTVTVQTVDTVEGNVAEASGSAADADRAAELEVRLLAMRCLESIFVVGSNRAQIRTAAGLVLQFIVDKHQIHNVEKESAEGDDWATSLMELIAKWCPVQDRFIILFTALENLREMPLDEQRLDQHVVLASLIDSLLKSPINMIGLSVIDVLLGFVQHILRLVQSPAVNSSPSHSSSADKPRIIRATENTAAATTEVMNEKAKIDPVQSATREKLVTLLQQCIGDLATHIYYADQVADMIWTVLKRIRPLTPSEGSTDAVVRTVLETIASATNLVGERHSESFFYSSAARVTALEAIKNILIVANLRKATAGAGVESRNKVGIQAWEGTQWLLRDIDRRVRCAYADAFLSWIQLETTKGDLKVQDSAKKLTRTLSKRENGDVVEKSTKRSVSTSTAPAEKTANILSSSFLQLLHLVLYENAIEFATMEQDVLLIHAILVNLIEHLGVNAVRFGLPMILKLQDDVATNDSLSSPAAQISIGSLVHGYLSALSEKFDFESSKVGSEIHGEILKRKKHGHWLERIRLPPLPAAQIVEIPETESVGKTELDERLTRFTAREELVRQIENAYTTSLINTPQSPPSSPGRFSGIGSPGQSHHDTVSQNVTLPIEIREQMLSAWSKEACLAVLDRESVKASSLSGSRTGTSVKRNYGQLNGAGNGSSNSGGSPVTTSHRHEHHLSGLGSFGSLNGYRRSSVPEGSHSSLTASSRDSTLRVNDLKRMLTVAGNSNVRRSSPLRGRLDAAGNSVTSSSSESMVSGAFSASDYGADNMFSRPQSIRETSSKASRDGSETPKASAVHLSSDAYAEPTETDRNSIPPVPPLPPGLSIPGGFPSDSASNLSRQSSISPVADRPMTAPGLRKSNSVKSKPDGSSAQFRTPSARKSRSSHNLHAKKRASSGDHSRDGSVDPGQRHDLEKLLDGIVPRGSDDGAGRKSIVETIDSRKVGDRRGISGGLGRPPY